MLANGVTDLIQPSGNAFDRSIDQILTCLLLFSEKASENVQQSDEDSKQESQQCREEPYDLVSGYKVEVPDHLQMVDFPALPNQE